MITVRCKCKQSVMKFMHLKDGDITEYEGSCCKDLIKQQEAMAALQEVSEELGFYDRKFDEPTPAAAPVEAPIVEEVKVEAEPSEALKELMAEQDSLKAEKPEKKFTYFKPKEPKK